MRLARFAGGRALIALVTILGVSTIVFWAMHRVPGGYEEVVLGPLASPERRALVAERYGLDDPIIVQYGRWLSNLVRGDLGESLMTRESVVASLQRRAPVTAELAGLALLFSLVLSIPLGLVTGIGNTRRSIRSAGRFFGALTLSVPDFVLGVLLLYLFSAYDLGLKVGGFVPFFDNPIRNLQAMALPAFTLSLWSISLIMRTTRDATMGVMTQPFIMAATARGESPFRIVRHHVFRNIAAPVVTVIAPIIGWLISGSIIVEKLFSVPGLGIFFVDAVQSRDYLVVQGGVLVASTIFIGANMAADIAYSLLDPRVGTRRALQRGG